MSSPNNEICEELTSTLQKVEHIRSYTLKFKLDAVQYAELHSNRTAAKKFNVDVRRICVWKTHKTQIREQSMKPNGKERKALAGAGRKPFNELVENQVLEWIYDRREKHLRVSCVIIMK